MPTETPVIAKLGEVTEVAFSSTRSCYAGRYTAKKVYIRDVRFAPIKEAPPIVSPRVKPSPASAAASGFEKMTRLARTWVVPFQEQEIFVPDASANMCVSRAARMTNAHRKEKKKA